MGKENFIVSIIIVPALAYAAPTISGANIIPGTLPLPPEVDPKIDSLAPSAVPRWDAAKNMLTTGDIWDTSGNVGIGTSVPLTSLHILGPGAQEISIQSSSANGRRWTLQSNAGSSGIHSSFQIIDRTAGSSRIGIDSVGQVGIGTTNPAAKLDVAGSLKAQSWAAQSASANGYANMGGVLIQWGTVAYNNSSPVTIPFPTAFNNLFSVTATVFDGTAGGSGANVPCKIRSLGTTSFQLGGTQVFSGDNTSTIKWMAIGN